MKHVEETWAFFIFSTLLVLAFVAMEWQSKKSNPKIIKCSCVEEICLDWTFIDLTKTEYQL